MAHAIAVVQPGQANTFGQSSKNVTAWWPCCVLPSGGLFNVLNGTPDNVANVPFGNVAVDLAEGGESAEYQFSIPVQGLKDSGNRQNSVEIATKFQIDDVPAGNNVVVEVLGAVVKSGDATFTDDALTGVASVTVLDGGANEGVVVDLSGTFRPGSATRFIGDGDCINISLRATHAGATVGTARVTFGPLFAGTGALSDPAPA